MAIYEIKMENANGELLGVGYTDLANVADSKELAELVKKLPKGARLLINDRTAEDICRENAELKTLLHKGRNSVVPLNEDEDDLWDDEDEDDYPNDLDYDLWDDEDEDDDDDEWIWW